ncbi:LysR family transcriptional regulator [Streptomyces sp. NPDC050481]|uniref:LysR family transcriptional regulator n=1 Tax=Streptomyces sp. NPDC050481 TaxID=3365616 RepID=UPI0037B8B9AD
MRRAAQRLGLSQPTVSSALARLRRHFDVELLTRVGNVYELAPLAEHTAQALGSADRVFQTRPAFAPRLERSGPGSPGNTGDPGLRTDNGGAAGFIGGT